MSRWRRCPRPPLRSCGWAPMRLRSLELPVFACGTRRLSASIASDTTLFISAWMWVSALVTIAIDLQGVCVVLQAACKLQIPQHVAVLTLTPILDCQWLGAGPSLSSTPRRSILKPCTRSQLGFKVQGLGTPKQNPASQALLAGSDLMRTVCPVLDVGGNSSIASFLRRSFTGSRGSVRALRGSRGPTHVPRRLAGPFHQEAMWPNCVVRVHAGPIYKREGTFGHSFANAPCNLQAATCNLQAVPCNLQAVPCNLQATLQTANRLGALSFIFEESGKPKMKVLKRQRFSFTGR